MIQQPLTRIWWPDAMADESMPEGRPDPADWLSLENSKIIFGRFKDEGEGFDFPGTEVLPGDAVECISFEHLGTFQVEFRSATDFFFTGVEAPKDYSECFVGCEQDCNANTLADLAEYIADSDGWYDLPVTIDIEFVRWEHVLFTVILGDKGPDLEHHIEPKEA